MNINVRLDKNFMTAYNRMSEKYGEEMAYLNGFGDKQLSYTDFIDNFIDKDTVADVSVDGNSNVSNKDMRTLMNEMPKSHRKLLAFNKIFYELNKKYGFKVANEWLEAEWTKALYMHDADTSTYIHYCYKGEECLVVKYKGKIHNISFNNLYDLVEEKEEYDVSIQQNAKFPNDLYVLDIANEENTWTKIKRIVKHSNTKPMRFIKCANGLSQIITEDHPIITLNGEVPAKDVAVGSQVYTIKPYESSTKNEKETYLTKDFGWVVGLCLAEGSAQPSCITLKQEDENCRNKLLNILSKLNMPYSIDEGNRVRIRVSEGEKILQTFLSKKTSAYKQLPSNFIDFPSDFMDGVVAGLIDGDGTIDDRYKERHCQIGITSEVLCHQISDYLRTKNIFCRDRTPHIYHSVFGFKQKLPMFGIAFTLTNEEYFLNIGSVKINNKYKSLVRRHGNFKNKKYQSQYGWINVIENVQYIEKCSTVFDITTETGHFICNNILSHNCFAYDLKDVAEKGLFFLNTFNSEPPKHLSTFIDFVKEFISFCSNRSSGAVGLPNIVPYMYYFWKKDCENGYATKSPEYYAKQQIQRFVYAINQPYTRDGIQSAFINCSVFDMPYLEALFSGATFPDGEPMLDSLEEIQDFQKVFMEEVAEIRHHNVMTFPVLTISLLRKNGKFLDEDFAKWGIEHNRIWSDSNLFIDDNVSSLSNCCRLKSDVRDLGYFNSIGGTALKVGSVKVSTLNLARLALEYYGDEEAYLANLKKLVRLDCQALDVVRHILKRNVEKGLLPNFTKGIVDFEHLYNTVGVIGIYETMKTFGYTYQDKLGNTFYSENADKFGEKIFKTIHEVKDDFMKDKDYKINLEQIPGESAAAKLLKADRFFYPETVVEDLPLYGNQFIPLGIKTTMAERIRIASLFDSFCNGGSIAHLNIDKPFDNFDKAWEMVNYIADKGLTYFAFNTKIQACAKNHGFYGKVCPICGGPVENEYTRIVGFYTPIKSWSKERKAEFKLREWEHI